MNVYDIMEKYFINGGIVAVLYGVLKFIDVRFISKVETSVREVARELVLVYMSSVSGFYLAEHINSTTIKKTTEAFVGKPTF